jgi:hypothetical protein
MMQWEIIVILVIAIPVILFPAAYVWYINIGGLATLVKEARQKRAAREKNLRPDEKALQGKEYEAALTETLKKYPW